MVKLNVVLPPISYDHHSKNDENRKRKSLSAPDQNITLPDINRHLHTAPESKFSGANAALIRVPGTKMKAPVTNKTVKFKPGNQGESSYREQYRPPTLKLCRECQHFWRFFRK